jgi:hypothetical protein
MGRSKKASSDPSALMSEVMKLFSNIGPSTRPRIARRDGYAVSFHEKPNTPRTSAITTP